MGGKNTAEASAQSRRIIDRSAAGRANGTAPRPEALKATPPRALSERAGHAATDTQLFEEMLDALPFNVMRADTDLVIRYLNPSSVKTLQKLEHLLPCKVEQIVGQSIDIFHKNPAHQRRILGNPSANLPHEADIKLGDETLHLAIAPLYNSEQEYQGTMVTWDVISDKLRLQMTNDDNAANFAAISRAQAVIEFEMDGTIITANDNFLQAMGYSLDEIKGRHHGIFVDEAYRSSAAYKEFWARLNRGEYQGGEFQRFGKGGKQVWIQATYNPILDRAGKPRKVVKYATEITAQKLQSADYAGQIAAIGKAQAVIEFNMDGTIIDANENFLRTMGYSLDEIKGHHHRMFVDEAHAHSAEYKEFWARLNRGEYQAAEYKRFGKGGKEVWIQASYNPILDLNGKPFKIVKYATDITPRVKVKLEVARLTDNEKLATDELIAVSEHMSANAEETSNQATIVAGAATQVSTNVQTVATGTEEMTASIREISKNVSEAARVATTAVKLAESTNETVAKLGASSSRLVR